MPFLAVIVGQPIGNFSMIRHFLGKKVDSGQYGLEVSVSHDSALSRLGVSKESLWDKPGGCKPHYIEKANYLSHLGA